VNSSQTSVDRATVRVRNVGGIDETEVAFEPGVTVLAGRNATNRSSLLQAVMAAVGGSDVSLKSDAEEGSVELTVGGERYTRQLRRNGSDVVLGGEPYLEAPETAELFAFLHEFNDARRAVERGADLRELILRPVDTGEISSRIAELKAQRRSVEADLSELAGVEGELAELEADLEGVEEELAAARQRLADVEADIEAVDADGGTDNEELDERMADLREARSTLERLEFRAESERESLERLRERRSELTAELEALPAPEDGELADAQDRLERLRERRRLLDDDISRLQDLIGFNEGMLGAEDGVLGGLESAVDGNDGSGEGTTDGSVTDRLVEGEQAVCWTCGSTVAVGQIERTVDRLTELRSSKFTERNDLDDEIQELKDRLDRLRSARDRRERLEAELADVREEIDERTDRLERIESDREATADRLAAAEAAVERLQQADREELRELRRTAGELEVEVDRLAAEREQLLEGIETTERRLERRDRLRERRERLSDQLSELRGRIERLEREAIEAFNEEMGTVLELLDYDNLERVWLERRKAGEEATFDLHVVRSTASGAAYEDTVEHLSESEREVIGLVVALAGYLVHDVHEEVPFVLLDSLEAIDADRIAALVEHFADHADYLVVALLPEDAAALEEAHTTVTEI
jgi:uncharacterized protein YhaN